MISRVNIQKSPVITIRKTIDSKQPSIKGELAMAFLNLQQDQTCAV